MFRVPPFPSFPNASRYVPVGTVREAMNRLVRSVEAREGVSLVIGPPGTGKSLLAQLLAKHFDGDWQIVQLGEGSLTDPAAFLRHVLHHVGIDPTSAPGGDLQLALVDHVRRMPAARDGLLLIIDEAQSLSEDVLEAIRLTTNVMREGQPRVCAVLCGGPGLEETLALPSLEPLVQRVSTRCYLHPMNASETYQYITESIRSCGASPESTIDDPAIDSVFQATTGVARLVNQLMSHAIETAEGSGQIKIDPKIIDRAWATLQQLPSPMVDEPEWSTPSACVEFGELTDDGLWVADQASNDPGTADDTAGQPVPEQDCESPCGDSCVNADDGDRSSDACCGFSNTSSIVAASALGEGPFRQDVSWNSAEPVDVRELAEPEFDTSESGHSEHESVLEVIGQGNEDIAQCETNETCLGELNAETPLPSALFGDFEDEEDLAVGQPTGQRFRIADRHVSAEETSASEDLETTLQIEVAEIAGEVREAQDGEQVQDGETEFFDADAEDGIRRENVDVVGGEVLWLTEDDSGEVVRDDSDLLIIEDDVPNEVEVVARSQGDESTTEEGEVVAVDFQAMLAKMRGDVE